MGLVVVRMPARSVCLVTLSLSEAGPGRFGGQVSVTDIYHTIPYHSVGYLPVFVFVFVFAFPYDCVCPLSD